MMLRAMIVVVIGVYSLLSAANDTLSGTVKESSGTAIAGAVVRLVKQAAKVDTTDDAGKFSLVVPSSGIAAPFGMSIDNAPKFGVKGKMLQFAIASGCQSATVSLFKSNGSLVSSIKMGRLNAGMQQQALPELAAGFYLVQVAVDGHTTTLNLIATGSAWYVNDAQVGTSGKIVSKTAAVAVDTLVASKSGYATAKVAVEVYSAKDVAIVLEKAGSVVCKMPALPASSALTKENPKLPDPFTFYDGTKLTKKSEWECRRQEILEMASKYIYGPCPPKPDEVTGTVSGGTVTINCKVGTKSASFSASISGSGEAICLDMSSGILPGSAKKLSLGTGNESKIKTLYGISEITPNLAAAWMVDRVMDVLELNPSSGHDPKKMMVSGCSGCGKGAFLVGAYSRIPLTIIVESGGGGAACLRQTEWFRHGAGKSSYVCGDLPQGIDNLEETGICGPWVAGVASWVRSSPAKVKLLPFDQHMLLACIAPRYLCHVTNQHGKNEWCHLGGTCEALSAWAAEPVWNALGVPENMGFLMYTESGAPGHCSKPSSATSLANEFFKRVFSGDATAKTDVMIMNDSDLQQPKSAWKDMWVDWNMETKLE